MPPGSFFHKLLARMLAIEARAILRRNHPEIIAITGSFGKSSAKEAIAAVLDGAHISFRKTPRNENTELGVPRTIIGGSRENSFGGWFRTLFHGLETIFHDREKTSPNARGYPQLLILEMAAEYPGDIHYLARLAPPTIGVMTGVGPAHGEFLGSPERILEEKAPVITRLTEEGWAILNADDDLVMSLAHRTRAKVLTYGFGPRAMIRGSAVINELGPAPGVRANAQYLNETADFFLPGVLGGQHVYAALAGIAVGVARGLPLPSAVAGLAHYTSLSGRMRVIAGLKQTTVIDDSYNAANPQSVTLALEVVSKLPTHGARYALLGDMRELGLASKKYHDEIGRLVHERGFDYFGFVGEMMKHAAAAAHEAGMSADRIIEFHNSREAGEALRERVRPGDIVLVKGSQNQIRMERAVALLMAEPDRAGELLVRQDPAWIKRD